MRWACTSDGKVKLHEDIFGPDHILTGSRQVNQILVRLGENRDPPFQADQSLVVWSAPEFEGAFTPHQKNLSDQMLQLQCESTLKFQEKSKMICQTSRQRSVITFS